MQPWGDVLMYSSDSRHEFRPLLPLEARTYQGWGGEHVRKMEASTYWRRQLQSLQRDTVGRLTSGQSCRTNVVDLAELDVQCIVFVASHCLRLCTPH